MGQSSIVADQVGLKLFDYHVTESGFGADIGFEKFWNVKCRFSGLIPHVSVLTTTVRGLKSHGVNAGSLPVPPGKPVPKEYFEATPTTSNGWKTACRMRCTTSAPSKRPVSTRWSASTPSISIPRKTDLIRRVCEAEGARVAVSKHWQFGGDGALEFADAVIDACKEKPKFKFLYPNDMPLRKRVETIAREVYGADGVDFAA